MPSNALAGDARFADTDQDDVQLVMRGGGYRNWFTIDIDSDIFTAADAFQFTARMPPPSLRRDFREGENAEVYIGDDLQHTGVIDDSVPSIDRKRSLLTVSGRDKGRWLVDDETQKISVANYSIKTLAEKLLRSEWGFRGVIFSNEENRKLLMGKKDRKSKAGRSSSGGPQVFSDVTRTRKSVTIDPGKTGEAILNEHCARLGVAWWISADGYLVIGKPNYSQQPAYSFYCFEGGQDADTKNNCVVDSVKRSMGNRCSDLEVWGSGKGSKGGEKAPASTFVDKSSANNVKFKASATDPDLKQRGISRKVILVDNDVETRKHAQERADREMATRRLKGLTINLTVPGFRQAGRLFAIDTLAEVKIEEADIDGIFWVSQRRFVEERKQRRTMLTLHEKGVWLP
jgi:prophage tail gpP-like protein